MQIMKRGEWYERVTGSRTQHHQGFPEGIFISPETETGN